MPLPEKDMIAEMRVDLATLGRDMAHVQRKLSEIRIVFSRLVWFLVIGLLAVVTPLAMLGSP